MKTCPFCGEKIQNVAVKCKFCGEWLEEKKVEKKATKKTKSKKVENISKTTKTKKIVKDDNLAVSNIKNDIELPEKWSELSERQKELLKKRFPISGWYKLLAFFVPHGYLLYARDYVWFIFSLILNCIPFFGTFAISIFVAIRSERLCYNGTSPNMKRCLQENESLRKNNKEEIKCNISLGGLRVAIVLKVILLFFVFASLLPRLRSAQNRTLEWLMFSDYAVTNVVKSIGYGRPTLGKENAKISLIVFSDPESPYCKRLIGEDKTLQEIVDENKDINLIYVSFPLKDVYPNSVALSEVIDCASLTIKKSKYFDFIEEVYDDDFNFEDIYDLINKFGGSKKYVENCVSEGNGLSSIEKNLKWIDNTSSTYGISGAPTIIVLNNETNKYEKVEGAYPKSEFINAINKIK